jgi:hypothetical protein
LRDGNGGARGEPVVTHVRPFRKDDVAAVVALRAECFRTSEQASVAALAAYFTEVFFGNPWYDERLPSLVCESGEGRIAGFLGVVPRRMTAYGVPLRVVTTTQLMVARWASPLVGSQLLRTLFEGPQALSLADVASPASRRLWQCLGGVTATSSSLTWIRLLRPLQHVMSSVAGRGMVARVGACLAGPVDAVTARFVAACARPAPPAHGIREAMSDADLLTYLTRSVDGRAVRGDYDRASLAWLLNMMARKHHYGSLRKAQIVDARGQLLGWYVFYAKAGGNARVAHLGARPGAAHILLDHLFRDGWREGCVAVSGRFDSRLVEALVERRCLVYGPDAWVLVHSRDRDLLDTIVRDDAGITRLDAEWWMAF